MGKPDGVESYSMESKVQVGEEVKGGRGVVGTGVALSTDRAVKVGMEGRAVTEEWVTERPLETGEVVAGGEDSDEESKETVSVVIGVAVISGESMNWPVIECVEEVSAVVELGAEYTVAAVTGEAVREEWVEVRESEMAPKAIVDGQVVVLVGE